MAPRHPLHLFRHCPLCGSSSFVEHDEKSKHCLGCGFTYYFNPSAATVAVIVDAEGRLLCCRRAKEPAKGTLDLCGGFCDCHETAEEGVIREVREEAGLEVVRTEFLFSLPNIYLYSGFEVHTVDNFFRCHVADIRPARAADDAAELVWLRPDEIRPELFGLTSVRRGVERLLREGLV